MTIHLDTYRDMLEKPWGKLLYDLIFAQLSHINNQTVLDFGAGFGLTATFLSKTNTVTAIEPNAEMLFSEPNRPFTTVLGSFEQLKNLPTETFDTIICHNVLEYILPEERPKYLQEFERLLKPGGNLSLIKHNQVGKVLQAVVFQNDIPLALELLSSPDYASPSFSKGSSYTIDDLLEMTSLKLKSYKGLRTFYSLQPNTFKTSDSWLEHMRTIELAVCDQSPYKDIAFLQHLTLIKE